MANLEPHQNAAGLLRLLVATAAGAFGGIWSGLPVPLLTGPAIVVTVACLAGVKVTFPEWMRQFVFLVAGIAIGATVSREALSTLALWPLAFVVLIVCVFTIVILGQRLMVHIMRVDRQTGLLASVPGHLSYVIALGESLGVATKQVSVVQTIRLLCLTLLVPLAIRLSGFESGIGLASVKLQMTLSETLACLLVGMVLGPLAKSLGVPAPLLLAGMVVGAVARLSGFSSGGLSQFIAFPALAAIGALIGTRFAGITMTELRKSLVAGLAGTCLAAVITFLAAWLASDLIGMPVVHLLVAFAPGGLETMAVIGATVGANPGFVATSHVVRLLFLAVLIPVMMARCQPRSDGSLSP